MKIKTSVAILLAWGGAFIIGCSKDAPIGPQSANERDGVPRVPSAAEVIERPGAVREFKEDINLTMKKQEILTAIEVESMTASPDKRLTPPEIEKRWQAIPLADRQSKSPDELKAVLLVDIPAQ